MPTGASYTLIVSERVTRQRQYPSGCDQVSHIDDGFINCRFKRHELLSNQAPIVAKTALRLLTNLLPTFASGADIAQWYGIDHLAKQDCY